MSSGSNIKVVDRTLQILQHMADHGVPLGVTEIGENLEIPSATVYRILSTLVDHDYVTQDPETQSYLLGPGILRLSSKVQIKPGLTIIVRPYLERLAFETEEMANLGILRSRNVLIVASATGRLDSKLALRLEPTAELHCSSLGKALLADMTKQEISALLGPEPFPRHTQNTKTTLEELVFETETIRSSKLSVDDEETEEGLMCFGSPIRDWRGIIVAAVSVSAPAARLDGQRSDYVGKLVMKAASEITERLQAHQRI
jgi:DNA-binding IclR family transcriptional regulator